LEARYGANLWEGARGWAGVKGGGYREVDNGPCKGSLSFFVSLTQKIIFGIPVTVQYAYSPSAIRDSFSGGHEFSVLVVAAQVFDKE
ncbi:MAG: hypothetical protein ACYTFG_12940, partial [Planctomycetota bacterium]